MDNNINNNIIVDVTENKAKKFWKNFGIFMLSLTLAVLTIVVINL